jgi:hypothetical protein
MESTFEVFQQSTCLKEDAPWNIAVMVVTRLVSQEDISLLKEDA